MNYSTKISERFWNIPDKGELESKREQTFIDDIVQKSHIEKELLSNLKGIKTVLNKQDKINISLRFFMVFLCSLDFKNLNHVK